MHWERIELNDVNDVFEELPGTGGAANLGIAVEAISMLSLCVCVSVSRHRGEYPMAVFICPECPYECCACVYPSVS